jgi:hypothetical protein
LEGLVLLVADQGFEWVRTRITGSRRAADRNARWVVRIERRTWTFHEHRLQQWVVGHRYVVEAFDIYYGIVHFFVPPIVLIVLWQSWPSRYARWRNTIVVATLLGLLAFWLYPLTPPRLYPGLHFTDTARTIGGLGPLDAGHFKDRNPYAAMPSLHMAWSTWCAFALAAVSRRWWVKVIWFAYPLLTLYVVVATANHWFADAVGGWVVLGLAWVAAGCISRFPTATERGTTAVPQGGEDACAKTNPPVAAPSAASSSGPAPGVAERPSR